MNGETLPVASSRDRHFSSGSAGGAAVESVECRTSQQTGPASKVIQVTTRKSWNNIVITKKYNRFSGFVAIFVRITISLDMYHAYTLM